MKILIIGDSCGLPRLKKGSDAVELYYEDTYPERVRKLAVEKFPGEDVLLVNVCRHANTSHFLLNGAANEVLFLRPDFVVIQLGMADLWPAAGRSVPPPFCDLAGKDPWVGPEDFVDNFDCFLRYCFTFPDMRVIIVNIPKCSQSQYTQHEEAHERTLRYNRLLHRFAAYPRVHFVDAYALFQQMGEAGIGSDGVHPTQEASRHLAGMIVEAVDFRGHFLATCN